MSHDHEIRDGLVRLAEPVADPHGSYERVLASSRRRTRRRRTFGVLMAAVLLGGGVALATSDDDDPATEVAGVTITAAPTTSALTAATVAGSPSATVGAPEATASVTTATSSTTLVCSVPYLVTNLPDGFRARLTATTDGSWTVQASEARRLALVPGAAPARPTSGVRNVELPAVAGSAVVWTAPDASIVADLTVPQGRCGSRLHAVARGLTDVELDAVLRGLRPQAACSAVGVAATPAAPAATPADLPAPVVATRAALRAAAAACDFEGLAALVGVNPGFVAEARGVRLADQWRLEDARGNQIMRAIVGLLDLAPRRAEPGLSSAAASWVWPSFAADPPATVMSGADLAALDRVYDAGYGDRFRNGFRRGILGPLADSYTGGIYVEIRADGVPVAITNR